MIPTGDFNKIIIVYHHNCLDGTAGAWVLKHYFQYVKHINISNIYLIGQQPQCLNLYEYFGQRNITFNNENRYQIIFVDICPTIDIIRQLITDNIDYNFNNRIEIYDHHETNKNIFIDYREEISQYIKYVFDMNKSGCQIAWDNFYDSPRPLFIDYIGEGDLWKFSNKTSKLSYNVLMHNFKNIDKLEDLYQLGDDYFTNRESQNGFYKTYLEREIIIDEYKQSKIKEYCNNAKQSLFTVPRMTIQGQVVENKTFNVWIVQCSDYELVSDIGNKICFKKMVINNSDNSIINMVLPDFGIIIKSIDMTGDNIKYNISLRSNNIVKPDINVASICNSFRGGGHPQAAGCTLTHNEFVECFLI